MNIYIYSDESGVFDKEHNDYFVFGGLIFLGIEDKENWSRKYSSVEKILRANKGVALDYELKATQVTNKEKGKLFRTLNGCYKFGVVIRQKQVLDRIFLSKKDKQRYLDYAYKVGLKKALQRLIKEDRINPDEIETVHIYNDEHSTATNGRYELREGLEQEFKLGTYNLKYDKFFPPVFENLKGIELLFCDSNKVTLIRAADIVANRIYFMALNRKLENMEGIYLSTLP